MQENLFAEIKRRMAGYPLLSGTQTLNDLKIPVCLSTVAGLCRIYLTGLDPVAMNAS